MTASLGTTVDTATDAVVTEALDLYGNPTACTAYGCGFHETHGTYTAAAIIDNVHSPASWTATPNADSSDCGTRAYVTIDLGAIYPVGRAIIWHYYGNT